MRISQNLTVIRKSTMINNFNCKVLIPMFVKNMMRFFVCKTEAKQILCFDRAFCGNYCGIQKPCMITFSFFWDLKIIIQVMKESNR